MRRPRKIHATWKEAARLLHQINSVTWSERTLSLVFQKNPGTVHWALNPEKRRELDRKIKRRVRNGKRSRVPARLPSTTAADDDRRNLFAGVWFETL